jgi:Fic family protein/DNA-binding XRE family transcriptional regulator
MADTLRSLRRRAGLSQAELARRCGVRQATLSAIEGGRARPQRATVAALAAALVVEEEELARGLRQGGASQRGASPLAARKAGAAAAGLGLGDWPFLAGLDADLRAGLATALVAQWSHSSTAIEGNTISAGDTMFVLTAGLTVSGKTLREHQELHGHAQAIRLMAAWTRAGHPIGIAQLHELHRAVQTGAEVDALAPMGKWKVEPNGTNALTSKGTARWHDYAAPADVPALIAAWLDLLAERCRGRAPAMRARRRTPASSGITPAALRRLVEAYTDVHLGFTAIHPYADGNGRMARLLANVPTLRAGQPPLLILSSRRRTYLTLMGDYSLRRGRPHPGQPLVRVGRERSALVDFFVDQWRGTLKLVADYQQRQRARRRVG